MALVQQAKGSTPDRPSTRVTMCVKPTANLSVCAQRVQGGVVVVG